MCFPHYSPSSHLKNTPFVKDSDASRIREAAPFEMAPIRGSTTIGITRPGCKYLSCAGERNLAYAISSRSPCCCSLCQFPPLQQTSYTAPPIHNSGGTDGPSRRALAHQGNVHHVYFTIGAGGNYYKHCHHSNGECFICMFWPSRGYYQTEALT